MNILLIGDVVGKPGRAAAAALFPALRREHNCCFCIANGENVAGGAGLSARCVNDLRAHGVDVVTTGDHVWDQRPFVSDVAGLPFVLRPLNVSAAQPGKGYGIEIQGAWYWYRSWVDRCIDLCQQAGGKYK